MERAKYNRHSRARMAEMAKDGARHATPDAPERIDPRRRCTDTIIGRAAADRAGARPYRAQVAKTRRNVPRRIARNASPPLG